MTIEEKLKHFYDTSVDEARRQAEKDVREHKEALDAALEEHKKMSLGNAASSRKAEIANAKREINKALSAEQLHIRRNWTARQSRLKEKLFADVRVQILKFMDLPAMKNIFVQRSRKLSASRNTMRSRSIFQKKMNPV